MKLRILGVLLVGLGLSACSSSDDPNSATSKLKEQAKALGETAIEATKETMDNAKEKTKEMYTSAKDKTVETYESAKQKTGEVIDAAKSGELKEMVVEKGAELKEKAKEKGAEIMEGAKQDMEMREGHPPSMGTEGEEVMEKAEDKIKEMETPSVTTGT